MFLVPSVVITAIGFWTLVLLGRAVAERAKSVDWWQKRLLRFEKDDDSVLHFATFRLAKEHSFQEPEIQATQLTEDQIARLLRPGTPKARQVFGVFVPGFKLLWATISACSVANFASALPLG